MKILWLSWSYITCEPWRASLESLRQHEISTCWYDRLPQPMDRGIMDAVDRTEPDVVLYTGMADWSKTPSSNTFRRIRSKCPIVHISGDLSDPPCHEFLYAYKDAECFTLTVNIDGNDDWPKWGKDYTALSPTAPQFYLKQKSIGIRDIDLGFAGSFSSPSRAEIINHLRNNAGMVIKPYNQAYGSYQEYASFLMRCKIVPNVPISGSDAVRQVKGRVLESGLAGCCLVDHVTSKASAWFEPYKDYFEYDTKESAAEVIKALLEAPELMQEVADNLQKKILRHHSPEQFWGRLFSRLA